MESPPEVPVSILELPETVRSKLLELAVLYGFVCPGWKVADYITNAVRLGRYCLVHLWGEQGSMKSNRTLQHGSWVYGEWVRDEWYPFWDKVLSHIVFRPGREERGLLAFAKQVPHGKREAWVGWDDVGVHYTSMTHKTDADKYAAIDSAFAAIRTKFSTMTTNNPNINRLAKNIKDNISIEEFIGPNQTYTSERLCRIVHPRKLQAFFFKVPIEDRVKHDWKAVPSDVWKEYWELRLQLADQAVYLLEQAFTDPEDGDEQAILIRDAVNKYKIPLSKIYSYSARGVIPIIRKAGDSYMKVADAELLAAEMEE